MEYEKTINYIEIYQTQSTSDKIYYVSLKSFQDIPSITYSFYDFSSELYQAFFRQMIPV